MGGCRALLYILGALCTTNETITPTLLPALLLFLYLQGLTLIARLEHSNRIQSNWPLLLLIAPLAFPMFTNEKWISAIWLLPVIFCIFQGIKFIRGKSPNVGRGVTLLIAGISLVDALFLANLGHIHHACLATIAFIATHFLQKIIRGS